MTTSRGRRRSGKASRTRTKRSDFPHPSPKPFSLNVVDKLSLLITNFLMRPESDAYVVNQVWSRTEHRYIMGTSIHDILSYEDSKTDILINYALLGITLVPTVLVTASFRPSSLFILAVPITLLAGLFAFQISLCLAVGCVGISIVWSALLGFVCVAEPMLAGSCCLSSKSLRCATAVSLVMCTAAWIYYAITEDGLTTVAHICAVVLGVLLGSAFTHAVKYRGHTTMYTDIPREVSERRALRKS